MFKQIAVAAALVIASSSALAQTTKFYAGLEATSSKLDDAGREGGFGGFVGYKFSETVAVEAGYTRLAKGTIDFDGDDIDVNVDQTQLSVIGTLPLSSGFNLYGRLGYNDIKVKAKFQGVSASDSLDDGVVYGVGLGYAFSPTVTGRLEVTKPVSELTKVAAGVAFHF
ncbi:outer membrane beta-barrel protein [Massilia suwonensis]|uniref:Outer membrane beta-barrel protein n=1 Tax=Massilia suwonensis TaxID=648895 RepID=A0ABW0MKZ2_9BURK